MTQTQRGGLAVALLLGAALIVWAATVSADESEPASPGTKAPAPNPVAAIKVPTRRAGVAPGPWPEEEAKPEVVLPTPSPQRSSTPALEDLPEKIRVRPFSLADGSFSLLWAAQQGEAADKACWTPLDADSSVPPRLVDFRVELDEQGRLTSATPALKQMMGTSVAGSRPQDRALKKLADCLQPFVLAINTPPGFAQRGVITAARPNRKR